MAYSNAIPQPTDNPSQSQSQLLANFQAIQSLIGINHINFNASQAGQHLMVTFYDNTGALPAQPTNNTLNVFNAQDSASVNQLWLRGPVTTQFATAFPFTQNNPADGGWTYLPSAIKMAWASVECNPGTNNISLNTALFGANFPGFTDVFNAQVTIGNPTVTTAVAVVSAFTTSNLQIMTNIGSGTLQCFIFIIGN